MSKCQYTSDVRQSVNKVIQDAYKKTLEKHSLRTKLWRLAMYKSLQVLLIRR